MNQLFGLVDSKQIIIQFFICSCRILPKNMSKWVKNEQKCPKISFIWQYSTLFDFKTSQPDLDTEYQNKYGIFLNNFSQSNNMLKLSFCDIVAFDPIVWPFCFMNYFKSFNFEN